MGRLFIGGGRPTSIPFPGDTFLDSVFAFNFALSSPLTRRGTLLNYPDNGISYIDPLAAFSNHLFPIPPIFSKRLDFIFTEYRYFETLYMGYFGSEAFFIALGPYIGKSNYSLLISNGNTIISNVKDREKVVGGWSFLTGYNLGKHLEDPIFYNMYIFCEVSGDSTAFNEVKVQFYNSYNLLPRQLYARSTFFRFGLSREINLRAK